MSVPIVVSQTGAGSTRVVSLSVYQNPFNVGIGCVLSGTATYTVEHTYDDIASPTFDPDTATWFPNADLTGETASAFGSYSFPVQGVRTTITSGTGTVTTTFIQATNQL